MRINKDQMPKDVVEDIDLKAYQSDLEEIKGSLASTPATSSVEDGGDIVILPFTSEATTIHVTRNGYLAETETDGVLGYQDGFLGGYAFTSASREIQNKTFNRIKVFVATPGWVRIGIVRGTGLLKARAGIDGVTRGVFAENPRYDRTHTYPEQLDCNGNIDTTADGQEHTTLKKWLVVTHVTSTGVYEFDIPDEIITSDYEFIYQECRSGKNGFISNCSGAALSVDGVSVASSVYNTGLTWPEKYLDGTVASGANIISNDMLDGSARYTHCGYRRLEGAGLYGGFNSINYNSADTSAIFTVSNTALNMGLYKRGAGTNGYLQPVIEAGFNSKTLSDASNHIKGFGPKYEDQQKIAEAGESIYAIDLIVKKAGDLTLYVFSSNNPATAKIVHTRTMRIRGIGKQRIHLPLDIKLEKGQWIGFGGATEATSFYAPVSDTCFASNGSFNAGYADTAQIVSLIESDFNIKNWSCKGDDETGVQDITPYSSLTGERSLGYTCWNGVKYVPGEATGDGEYDFTNATIEENDKEYLNITLITRGDKVSKLEDLWCSITGDSISTYTGVCSQSTDLSGIINNTSNNSIYYPNGAKGFLTSFDSTWWGALIKQTRMRLLRNDAWSGSKVSGTQSTTNSSACAASVRVNALSGNTPGYTANINEVLSHPYGRPDIVFCCIGTNDLSGGVDMGSYTNTKLETMDTMIGAFQTMIQRHTETYPQAKFIYFILPRGSAHPYPYVNSNDVSIPQLAASMEYVAKAMGQYFVPLSYFNGLKAEASNNLIWVPNTGYVIPSRALSTTMTIAATSGTDKLHPSAIGSQIIANALQRYCENTL